jgi:hypothetical protein
MQFLIEHQMLIVKKLKFREKRGANVPQLLRYAYTSTVKLGYSNIGFCDTLSIASNIINIIVLIIQRYSFIATLFLGPFDDVITKFYCITELLSTNADQLAAL